MDKRIKQYISGVMDGSILVGRYVKLTVERHLRDLKEGPKRGLEFDEDAALHVIQFFEDFLHHSKGFWADHPFILEPWEALILWVLFGWKRKATGARRFKMSYISVARKNGKSTLASGVGLYLMVADNEQGAEVYSAATKRDQAKIVWDEAKRMVQKSPHLREFVKMGMNTISVLRTNSKFEPLGKDSDTMDGLNISGAVIDELHAHKTREIFDILATSTGARRQPLLFVITTMVYAQESICAEQNAYSEAVLKGDIEDDSHFAYVATLDEGDDWHDEKSWVKANPNLGVTVEIDEIREQFLKAKESPAFEAAFRRLRLNEPVSPDVNKFLPMDKWDECQGPLDVKRPEEREQFIKDLEGERCYAGLDLASTSDLAALVLIFPSEDKQTHKVLPYFWIPEENLKQRARKDRVPYPVWKSHGFIEATPGNVIDYNAIMVKLMGLKDRFDLKELVYDDWNSAKFVQDLQGLGFSDATDERVVGIPLVKFRQTIKQFAGPTQELLKLVLSGGLIHGGNPILRWNADNLVVEIDSSGNFRPSKKRSREKIDGIVALIMGLSRAMVADPHEVGSIYNDIKKRPRGIILIGEEDEEEAWAEGWEED